MRALRHVALDLDGTVYRGGTLFDFTLPFLGQMSALGIGVTYVTNNSSKSVADYVAHLNRVGVPARLEQVYTSTLSVIEYLHEVMSGVRRLFVLGTASMQCEMSEAGFELTTDDPADEPEAVIVGFDTGLTYARLCRAAYWISQNKPYIASHPDLVCPTDAPTVLVDCGAICAALNATAGRLPDAVLGKPDPRMLGGVLNRHHLAPAELAMIGDRLYTDVAMARQAGTFGVLVLSGEATRDDVAHSRVKPDLVAADLAEFAMLLQCAQEG